MCPPPPAPIKLNGKVTKKTISLKKGAGGQVALAGKYKLVVSDVSKTENFHLNGPGVNKKTGVKTKAAPPGR